MINFYSETHGTVDKAALRAKFFEEQNNAPIATTTETTYRIMCQMLTFLNCYSLARVLASKRFYNDTYQYEMHASMLSFYVLSYLLNGFILLPRTLPWATVLINLPPFMDEGDYARITKIVRWRELAPFGVEHGRMLLARRSPHYLEEHGLSNFTKTKTQTESDLTKTQSQIVTARSFFTPSTGDGSTRDGASWKIMEEFDDCDASMDSPGAD